MERTAPTTIDGIKRRAKKYKKDRGMTHTEALNIVAQEAGYATYADALHKLSIAVTPIPASIESECTCEVCGCSDSRACESGCSWAWVDRKNGIGVCSRCA